MKFGIQTRLFVAFISTIALVVLAMALAINWSFERGFVDYLRKVEMERLDPLLETLSKAYEKHQNWDFLRHEPLVWEQLMDQGLGEQNAANMMARPPPRFPRQRPGLHRPPDDGWRRPPAAPDQPPHRAAGFDSNRPPPRPFMSQRPIDPMDVRPRLRLLDADRAVVFGPRNDTPEVLRAVLLKGATIGYLALRTSEIQTDALAKSFQAGQRRTYLMIAFLALLLSALSALFIARRMIKPIRLIASGADALGAGRYQTRIDVQRSDELGRLATDFNQLAAALQRNEQTRRQWIADISHELRTPLAVLRGEIEALQDGVRALSVERLNSLHIEVLSLGKLVDDLYELALSDAGALDYKREPLDLAEILDETVQHFQHRFEQKGVALINRVKTPAPLRGDPRRLQQLFTNLLENSQRYTDSGGRLEISLTQSAHRYQLLFQDSAPAVPDAALARIFERLYRVDKSRSRSLGGAGLGLAICQNIVEAHDGRLQASHSTLGGLALRVEFPIQAHATDRSGQ